MKQEDFSLTDSPFRNPASHPFMVLTGQNPLFAQDRAFTDLCSRSIPHSTASPLGFLPINRDRARAQLDSHDNDQSTSEGATVKVEPSGNVTADHCLEGRGPFLGRTIWDNGDNQEDNSGGRGGLDMDELGM